VHKTTGRSRIGCDSSFEIIDDVVDFRPSKLGSGWQWPLFGSQFCTFSLGVQESESVIESDNALAQQSFVKRLLRRGVVAWASIVRVWQDGGMVLQLLYYYLLRWLGCSRFVMHAKVIRASLSHLERKKRRHMFERGIPIAECEFLALAMSHKY